MSTTFLDTRPIPRSGAETYAHLLADHGWSVADTPMDPSVMGAHNYAHGGGGRWDLEDKNLAHIHEVSGSNGWKAAFIVWNLLAVIFVAYSLWAGGSAASDCVTNTSSTYVGACQTGAGIGATVLLGVVLFVTLVGNGTLGVAYAIFRKQR